MSYSRFRCPHCNSENTQKLSLIYENGIADTELYNTDIIFVDGKFGVGVGKSYGVSQTVTSQRAAPPERPSLFIKVVICIILCYILVLSMKYFFFGLMKIFYYKGILPSHELFMLANTCYEFIPKVIGGLAFFYLLFKWYETSSAEYDKEFYAWVSSYKCMRCGSVFRV